MRALRYTLALFLISGLGHAGCSPQGGPQQQGFDDVELDDIESDSVNFVNRVWQVRSSSSVEPGMLYVFLSEGTLLIASDHGTPSLGAWKYESGKLTIVEEGLPHTVDVLQLSADQFRIRVNNPGEPVEIEFVSATTD